MAEAATIQTTDPKQLGKQLRAVRRRKGLSLSEVARGAGLSRRELVAYERGKVPIPESDLWVLAGSCGVDIKELTPDHAVLELEAGPESIGDTIAFLRRGQHNGSGRAVLALEAADTPAPVYSGPQAAPVPAPPPVSPEPFFTDTPFAASAFVTASTDGEPTTAAPVDVFEELARLPEPVPLTDEPYDYPDLLAPPAFLSADVAVESAMAEAIPFIATMGESATGESATVDWGPIDAGPIDAGPIDTALAPPEGTFELVDDQPFVLPGTASVADVRVPGYGDFDAPTVVDATPETVDRSWSPEDAPPIDVALRGEMFTPTTWTTDWQPDGTPAWETPDWESATSGVWNEPDTTAGTPEWSANAHRSEVVEAWEPTDPFDPQTDFGDHADDDAVGVIALRSYEDLRDLPPLPVPVTDPAHAQWAHEPDPAATSSGFLVDWGDPDAPITPRTGARTRGTFETTNDETDTVDDDIDATDDGDAHTEIDDIDAVDELVAVDQPSAWQATEPLASPDDGDAPEGDVPAPISWPQPGAAAIELAAAVTELAAPLDRSNDPSPEAWVTADDDWELGNALPLVEVRGQGSLVMRRADERWALANLTVSDRYLVEVDVEFRAGPGFGVLFRADVDDDGRMSAYSFDVDPVYEGGGYLVRQWQADRELWNPIAHVAAADPSTMYGNVTVRLDVANQRLVACVNDTVVMTIDDLEQGSVERGRQAPTGRRIGVQAWSSSDLVIETLRIADR